MTGGGMMGAFLALMVSGLPVAMAMAGAALIYVAVSGNVPEFVVIHRMYGGVDSFPLLAVPFFIWAGNLMNSAGITNRIYNFALALVGWLKGGLGHVNVVGSMIFAGMSPDRKFVEMVELSDHPWFLGCQFHPEFKSKPLEPHPLFASFVAASYANKQARERDRQQAKRA